MELAEGFAAAAFVANVGGEGLAEDEEAAINYRLSTLSTVPVATLEPKTPKSVKAQNAAGEPQPPDKQKR